MRQPAFYHGNPLMSMGNPHFPSSIRKPSAVRRKMQQTALGILFLFVRPVPVVPDALHVVVVLLVIKDMNNRKPFEKSNFFTTDWQIQVPSVCSLYVTIKCDIFMITEFSDDYKCITPRPKTTIKQRNKWRHKYLTLKLVLLLICPLIVLLQAIF